MTTAPSQSARLEFRVSSELKALIEQAAAVSGLSLTSFAAATLSKAAEELIQQTRERTLSARDSRTFLEMLDDDAEPNNALKQAAARYKGARHR